MVKYPSILEKFFKIDSSYDKYLLNKESANINFKVRCALCDQQYSGSIRSFTNFKNHVQNMHNKEYLEYEKKKKTPSPQKNNLLSMTATKIKNKYNRNNGVQLKLEKQLTRLIVNATLPINILDNKDFMKDKLFIMLIYLKCNLNLFQSI